MYHQTNRKSGLERITEKEIMEEKVRKRGYTMTFPTKEEVACVASVSSRGSSRKLGQEQKK